MPLPVSIRKPMLKQISKSTSLVKIKQFLSVIFLFVFILFLDSLSKLRNHAAHSHSSQASDDPLHIAKIFYAQRNAYLTGSVLFLALVLNRFHGFITELVNATENLGVLKGQAGKTSAEYMKMLDKEKELQSELDEKNKELEEEKKKSRNADLLVKQAKQTNDEYLKLTDRYVELEKKVCTLF